MMWLDAAASGFGLGEVEQALTKAVSLYLYLSLLSDIVSSLRFHNEYVITLFCPIHTNLSSF